MSDFEYMKYKAECNPPVITLKNGLRIANFSSPHSFKFTTGEELPACSPEVANLLKLDAQEVEHKGIKGTTDIELTFSMTSVIEQVITYLQVREDIDVVLVPFPVMTALKEANWSMGIGKCRVIRVADRVTKAIYPDKFCC